MGRQTGGPADLRDERADRYARQRAAVERAETADFDAWRAQRAPTTLGVRIAGRTFHLPKQAPLAYTLETERHRARNARMDTADLRRMVAMLFGGDALDHIIDAGYDHDDLGVLIMYATANIGSPTERVSFGEAAEFYRQAEQGKALPPPPGANRGQRRNAKRKRGRRSSGIGG